MSITSSFPTKTLTKGVAMFKHKEDTLEPDDHALLNPLRWAEVVRLGQEGWELVSVQPLMRGVTEIGNPKRPRLGFGASLCPVSYPLFFKRATSKNTPDPRRVFLAEWNQGDRQADRTLICKIRREHSTSIPSPKLPGRLGSAVRWSHRELSQRAPRAGEPGGDDPAAQRPRGHRRRGAQGADETGQRFYFDYSRLALTCSASAKACRTT